MNWVEKTFDTSDTSNNIEESSTFASGVVTRSALNGRRGRLVNLMSLCEGADAKYPSGTPPNRESMVASHR